MPKAISVTIETSAGRLDRFLAALRPDVPRSRWEAWIGAGMVLVNGSPARKNGLALRPGDALECDVPDAAGPAAHLEPEDLDLATLFEDARLWIIDKPAGMVVHPGPGHRSGTVLNALLARLGRTAPAECGDGGPEEREDGGPEERDGEFDEGGGAECPKAWPGLVHRLDRYTSGCMAMAKDDEAKNLLQAQFKARTVEKTYLAIARQSRGLPELGSLLVEAPIARHRHDRTKMAIHPSGRPAGTVVKVLQSCGGLALVSCGILTGRTHQIRVHLASLGAPLLGDPLYGGPRAWKGAGGGRVEMPHPALHAWKLALDHPDGGRVSVRAEPPPDLAECMRAFFSPPFSEN